MFKKASDNAQARTDRKAEFSRQNEAGVDPGAFSAHPKANRSMTLDDLERERIILINLKQEMEEKISLLKTQIDSAERAFHTARENALSRQLYQLLLRDRDNLQARRIQTSQQLREINLAISDQKRAEQKSKPPRQKREAFADIFYQIAKEMLATPILNRLTVATIHRMGEHIENQSEDTK